MGEVLGRWTAIAIEVAGHEDVDASMAVYDISSAPRHTDSTPEMEEL